MTEYIIILIACNYIDIVGGFDSLIKDAYQITFTHKYGKKQLKQNGFEVKRFDT